MRICFALLIGLFLTLPATAEELEVITGKLLNVTGDAMVMKRGGKDWVGAFDNMTISMGDQIATGMDGEATLEFDNSMTQVKPMTQFIVGRTAKVEEGTYTELFLQAGKVISDVTKAPKGSRNRFNVITPVSVVGVRGTVQTVEYNPGVGQESDIRRGTGFMAALPSDKLPAHVKVLLGIEPEPGAEQAAPSRKRSEDKPEFIEVSDIQEAEPIVAAPPVVDDTAILAGLRNAWSDDTPSWNAQAFWKIDATASAPATSAETAAPPQE